VIVLGEHENLLKQKATLGDDDYDDDEITLKD